MTITFPSRPALFFHLQAMKTAEEHPEFTVLQNENRDLLKTHQLALKATLIKMIQLEKRVLNIELNKFLCESFAAIVSLF
jgi:hypothetical protein